MADPKKKDTKIMDVAHPGKTAPSENSKSVIVGHGPMMKDPMVVEGDSDKIEPPKEDLSKRTSKSVIQPLGSEDEDSKKEKPKSKSGSKTKSKHKLKEDDDKKTIAALAAEVDAEDVEDSETPDKEEDEKNIPPADLPMIDVDEEDNSKNAEESEEDEKKEEPQDEKETDSDNPDDDKAEKDNKNKETNPNEAELKNDEEEKHQKEIQKLAESKQYYLPINTVENRRSKKVLIFGIILSVILIIAWIDIALDAGLIELGGLEPVTSFFSN